MLDTSVSLYFMTIFIVLFLLTKGRLISTEFDRFVACQGTLQMSFRRHMCPSSAMQYATLLITTTTRSPPPCSVPVMRKEALMLVRSVFSSVYVFWCPNLVFLCPLIHMLAFLYLGGLFDLLNLWHRETVAVPSWQKTVCPRPAGIACSELWAGERAVPWPRNLASTPKFPGFFPGYLQPWGWETLFLLWSLFVIMPEEVLQMCLCLSSPPTELSQLTRGAQIGSTMKLGMKLWADLAEVRRDLLMGNKDRSCFPEPLIPQLWAELLTLFNPYRSLFLYR